MTNSNQKQNTYKVPQYLPPEEKEEWDDQVIFSTAEKEILDKYCFKLIEEGMISSLEYRTIQVTEDQWHVQLRCKEELVKNLSFIVDINFLKKDSLIDYLIYPDPLVRKIVSYRIREFDNQE